MDTVKIGKQILQFACHYARQNSAHYLRFSFTMPTAWEMETIEGREMTVGKKWPWTLRWRLF
jgi:hypothetical protein